MGSKTEPWITIIYLGRVDSSGVRIYYTDKLRQYDSGVVSVGVGVNQWHIIPPDQKEWMSVGYCTARCTDVSMDVLLKLISSPYAHSREFACLCKDITKCKHFATTYMR